MCLGKKDRKKEKAGIPPGSTMMWNVETNVAETPA